MKYFAYGSNMSFRRIQRRISGAEVIGPYVLKRHDLRFHKISDWDGSAKCDVYHTGKKEDRVIGVLYHIRRRDKHILDEIEGLGTGYEEKEVTLQSLKDQSTEKAITYYATKIDYQLLPFRWYLYHVLIGSKEAGAPAKYISKLKSTETVEDPDTKRKEDELIIYDTPDFVV